MLTTIFALITMQAGASAPAQVQNLSGCFNASYRFVEDGKHDLEITGAIEEILFEERADGSFYLQHYGIWQGEKYKHFGEQWFPLAGGHWKQVVYSPSGSVRYECVSPFVFNQF